MKLNKTLLSIGTLAAVVTPIATVVSCGDKTPTTPTNINPTKGNAGNQGPSNTGNPSNPTAPVALKSGIIDCRTDKTESIAELNKVFDKFTKNISFTGSSIQGALANIGGSKVEMNKNRQLEKVLIVTNPTSNNGDVVFYAGLIGYDKSAGDTSSYIYFTFKDFKVAANVGDNSPHGSVKQINISDPGTDASINFVLTKNFDSNVIVREVRDYAKSKFATATFK